MHLLTRVASSHAHLLSKVVLDGTVLLGKWNARPDAKNYRYMWIRAQNFSTTVCFDSRGALSHNHVHTHSFLRELDPWECPRLSKSDEVAPLPPSSMPAYFNPPLHWSEALGGAHGHALPPSPIEGPNG